MLFDVACFIMQWDFYKMFSSNASIYRLRTKIRNNVLFIVFTSFQYCRYSHYASFRCNTKKPLHIQMRSWKERIARDIFVRFEKNIGLKCHYHDRIWRVIYRGKRTEVQQETNIKTTTSIQENF